MEKVWGARGQIGDFVWDLCLEDDNPTLALHKGEEAFGWRLAADTSQEAEGFIAAAGLTGVLVPYEYLL